MAWQHLVSVISYLGTHRPSKVCFHWEHDFPAIVQHSSEHKCFCISLAHQSLDSWHECPFTPALCDDFSS